MDSDRTNLDEINKEINSFLYENKYAVTIKTI